jgi:lactate 2-monooxygenase
MGTATRFFQLYWSRDRELTRSFLRRAESAGYTAVVVTLDTRLLGWRPRDLDLGHNPFLLGKGLAGRGSILGCFGISTSVVRTHSSQA